MKRLVSENKTAIFGQLQPDFRLLELTVSEPLHHNEDRYHHLVSALYRNQGGTHTKDIWVKVRDENLETLFNILAGIYERMPEARDLFPKPYFSCRITGNGRFLLGMERVQGEPLRNMLLRQPARELGETLRDFGAKLRAFHDASPASGVKRVRQMADNARNAVCGSSYLSAMEQEQAARHIDAAEAAAGAGTELPLIKIHNDCILRNVLVAKDGRTCLIDLDSLRAPPNSRWYDLAYFLISLESQSKYAPLVTDGKLADLWWNFIAGYTGRGLPDGVHERQMQAILLIIKLEYMLGGTFRVPTFRMFDSFLGRRYLKRLARATLLGRYSILPSTP